MTKRARPSEWEAYLYAELSEARSEPLKEDTTVTEANPTSVPHGPIVDNPVSNEKLGEGPFWELLSLARYTKW